MEVQKRLKVNRTLEYFHLLLRGVGRVTNGKGFTSVPTSGVTECRDRCKRFQSC